MIAGRPCAWVSNCIATEHTPATVFDHARQRTLLGRIAHATYSKGTFVSNTLSFWQLTEQFPSTTLHLLLCSHRLRLNKAGTIGQTWLDRVCRAQHHSSSFKTIAKEELLRSLSWATYTQTHAKLRDRTGRPAVQSFQKVSHQCHSSPPPPPP